MYQRIWAGNRAAALNEIGRLQVRGRSFRSYFNELAGKVEAAPSCPDGIAEPAHGKAA